MTYLVADEEPESLVGPGGRIGLALVGLAAFVTAIGVAPYAVAAFASLGWGAAWDWAVAPVASLPLLLLALTLVAARGAYTGKGRPVSFLVLLVLANLAILLWFWA